MGEEISPLKRFYLYRERDPSGVSGLGRVAEGVEFPDGRCIIYWNRKIKSIIVYDKLKDVKEIHSHKGCTDIVFVDKEN